MSMLQKIFYFLSPYTDKRERRVALYFSKLSERSSTVKTRNNLLELMQSNIAVINLWTEHKYKGYRYLRKSHRKELYDMLDVIAAEFELFRNDCHYTESYISNTVNIGPNGNIEQSRAALLIAIAEYLSPKNGVYEYRASSSFGRLLRDPKTEKLVGDCNQIVTLYIYLYSRYFSVQDLQVRLLPGHVALYYSGVDIEATNGTFTHYDNTEGAKLMPIEEIVSINLLDITDSYLETHEVVPEDFLQSARFAFVLSHDRSIVTRNLEAAYAIIVKSLMIRHNFSRALTFAKQSRDLELRAVVGNNAAIYYMQQSDYAKARKFAEYSINKKALISDSYHSEGAHLYNKGYYNQAIQSFKLCNDQDSVRKCYSALFFAEQAALPKQLTTGVIKAHSKTIKRMHLYAKKSGNKELIHHIDSLNKYL